MIGRLYNSATHYNVTAPTSQSSGLESPQLTLWSSGLCQSCDVIRWHTVTVTEEKKTWCLMLDTETIPV